MFPAMLGFLVSANLANLDFYCNDWIIMENVIFWVYQRRKGEVKMDYVIKWLEFPNCKKVFTSTKYYVNNEEKNYDGRNFHLRTEIYL